MGINLITFVTPKVKNRSKYQFYLTSLFLLKANTTGRNWWPIMEKQGPFSYQMYDALTKGNIKKIPIIIGFNSEEWLYDSK